MWNLVPEVVASLGGKVLLGIEMRGDVHLNLIEHFALAEFLWLVAAAGCKSTLESLPASIAIVGVIPLPDCLTLIAGGSLVSISLMLLDELGTDES